MTIVRELGRRAKAAKPEIARASGAQKNEALLAAADRLLAQVGEIISANVKDLTAGEAGGISATVLDRLRLDETRLQAIAGSLQQIAGLPDPVGEVRDGCVRPNGLRIRRVNVPLGVVGVIYENRPNVTSDAAGICVKAGNVAFLRGSSGAINSNIAIARALRDGMTKAGLPADTILLIEDTSRESAVEFMQLRGVIDCLVPRGGPSLISSILEHATVPYVIDGDGNCHIYVDAAADLAMAESIVINAKTQRPSVCNAAESLLVHESVASTFLPRLAAAIPQVELVGDERARAIVPSMGSATEDDFSREFLDFKMSVAVVDDIETAISHIARHGSGHSEAIVTSNLQAAQRFTGEVDAAAVLVNASTRFVDGEEFGFGAEIGISTQKLHARGPMGPRELTTFKYIVEGNGHIRS